MRRRSLQSQCDAGTLISAAECSALCTFGDKQRLTRSISRYVYCVTLFRLCYATANQANTVSDSYPLLVADRGNVEEYPEHTYVGLTSALSLGAKYLRLDVQLSSDGIPMLSHDDGLLRVSGSDKSIINLPSDELIETWIGEPMRFGKMFAEVGMLRLADALPLLTDYPDAQFFIDLQHASIAHFGHDQVVQAVIDSCRQVRSRIVVLSTDVPAIYRARQAHGLKIGWCLEQIDSHTRLKYQALLPDFLVADIRRLRDMGRVQPGPWQWMATGVDSVKYLRAAAVAGVSYVATQALRTLQAADVQA
jgi:glycerophosphoryl diester phosphodiesterase